MYEVRAHGQVYTCTPRGIFRERGITPLVGDEVIFSEDFLHTIKPRTNALTRPAAANIGQVIVTVATVQPAINAGILDRFLLLIENEDIPIVICVNKSDMAVGDMTPYEMAGYPVIFTAATENKGIEELRGHMRGKTNLFAGPSGVGKSSLINALLGMELETGILSKRLGRGKHTTRHTQLFPLGNTDADGFVFDTPGFTSLDTDHIPAATLAWLFREFRPHVAQCKFANCLHHREIGCAVKAAVSNGEIHKTRHESYAKLLTGESGK
jgi:ribosome biogenesis GTPase